MSKRVLDAALSIKSISARRYCDRPDPTLQQAAPGAGEACMGPIRGGQSQVPVARAQPVRYPAGKA